jgi:septum formation protein
MMPPQLYLASASPRRRELLDQVGIRYELVGGLDVDESRQPDETAEDYAMRLACEKARAGQVALAERAPPTAVVLGADTCIALDGNILGKPVDRDHGLAMLAELSGRSHEVLTAICLLQGDTSRTALSRSVVAFAPLEAVDIVAYWDTGEPVGKAGAYAIQGQAARFITRLEGSYSGVVGLPVYELSQLLSTFNHQDHAPGNTD